MALLSAGVARAVITPPVGYHMGQWGLRKGRSDSVHRDLLCRTVVFQSADTTVAVIALDICGMHRSVSDMVYRRISALTGVSRESVVLNSSHSHTAPDFLLSVPDELGPYSSVLADTIAGTVRNAIQDLEPVATGYGRGSLEGWGVNRQYPGREIDTSVHTLKVQTVASRETKALLVNYPLHGVSDGGQYLSWSADFPGEMCASIESELPGSTALFLQGAGGDIHPFDWWFGNRQSDHFHTHEDTAALGKVYADVALELESSIEASEDSSLKTSSMPVVLPRRTVEWTVEQAKQQHESLVAKLGPYTRDTWPEGTTTANAAELFPELYEIGRNELTLAESQALPGVEVNANAIRIGETVISSHPGELFNELGVDIRERAGTNVLVASYCGEYIGYVSTRNAYDDTAGIPLDEIIDMKQFRRYYGTTTSPYAPEAGEILVDAAVAAIRKV